MANEIIKGNENPRVFFKLKELHGDQSIWLGQSILALMALNKSPSYSDKMNKSFDIELLTSIMLELGITPEDITNEINLRNESED